MTAFTALVIIALLSAVYADMGARGAVIVGGFLALYTLHPLAFYALRRWGPK